MNDFKGTPEPWFVTTVDGSIGSVEDIEGAAVAQALQTRKVGAQGNQERIANAQLISAAPELLAALHLAVLHLKHYGKLIDCKFEINVALAAIDKAIKEPS